MNKETVEIMEQQENIMCQRGRFGVIECSEPAQIREVVEYAARPGSVGFGYFCARCWTRQQVGLTEPK